MLLALLSSVTCAASKKLKPLSTNQLVEKLQEYSSNRKSVSAELVLKLATLEGHVQQRASLVSSDKGRMRLDLRGPHGGVLMVLLLNGQKIDFMNLQENLYVKSDLYNPRVSEIFPFLPQFVLGRNWSDLLLGNIVPPLHFKVEKNGDAMPVLVWFENTLEHRMRVEPARGRLVTYTIHSEGTPLLHIDYEKWRQDGFVAQMKIVLPRRHITLELHFRDVQKNLNFSPNIFKLRIPEGMREEVW